MGTRGLGRLPVVAAQDADRLVGWIRRDDIIRAYHLALSRRAELQHRAKRMQLPNIDGTVFSEIHLQASDRNVGKKIAEIAASLPKDCILVSIRRGGRMLIPRGDTVLQADDRITVFAAASQLAGAEQSLHG
jgi:CIC family chloride channel protein